MRLQCYCSVNNFFVHVFSYLHHGLDAYTLLNRDLLLHCNINIPIWRKHYKHTKQQFICGCIKIFLVTWVFKFCECDRKYFGISTILMTSFSMILGRGTSTSTCKNKIYQETFFVCKKCLYSFLILCVCGGVNFVIPAPRAGLVLFEWQSAVRLRFFRQSLAFEYHGTFPPQHLPTSILKRKHLRKNVSLYINYCSCLWCVLLRIEWLRGGRRPTCQRVGWLLLLRAPLRVRPYTPVLFEIWNKNKHTVDETFFCLRQKSQCGKLFQFGLACWKARARAPVRCARETSVPGGFVDPL